MTISHIAVLPTSQGRVLCGAERSSFLNELTDNLVTVLPDIFTSVEEYSVTAVQNLPNISGIYAKSLEQPQKSANWHLLQGASTFETVSVIDWWTFLDASERELVVESLFEKFIEHEAAADIHERSDIGHILEQAFPLVGRHGLEQLIGKQVWDYVKTERPEQLSADSRGALENGINGAQFEQFFKNFCAENGLTCYKPSAPAFARLLPKTYDQIRKDHGRLTGIPDFFVDKKNTDSLASWLPFPEREWEPTDRYAFVECKYNESRLSARQKNMVGLLKDHGIETHLLQGDQDTYRFEQL